VFGLRNSSIKGTRIKKIISGRKVQIPEKLKLIQVDIGSKKTEKYLSFFIGMIEFKNNNKL
jgi:hypothetical protein